jgi:uncharacterized lipoprotein NlpE involved in copper resistance
MPYLYGSPKNVVMKKRLLGTIAGLLLLTSCHANKPEIAETPTQKQIAARVAGVFAATIPCSDCPGTDIEISFFKDHTFCRTTYNRGADPEKTKVEKGSWTVESDSIVTIELEKNLSLQYYKLRTPQELAMLTKDKQAVAGELANKYLLHRR